MADLVDRGLDFDDGLLVVLDGAKALLAAVREVFGDKALIQRCTLHKRRNIADHLPDKEKAWVDAKLVKAFNHPDPDTGLRNAKSLAATAKGHPRSRVAAGGAGGDVDRHPAGPRRPPRQDAKHIQPHPIDDLHRESDGNRNVTRSAWRSNCVALDRGGDAQCPYPSFCCIS